jgi:hypothetical protein
MDAGSLDFSRGGENDMIRAAILEGHGTTGWQILDCVAEAVVPQLGGWPPLWRVIIAETQRSRPGKLPAGWFFEAVGEPLSQLYKNREKLQLPDQFLNLPEQVWCDTYDGAQKLPAAAALCFALHRESLDQARQEAWEFYARPGCLAETERFLASVGRTMETSFGTPIVAICAAAGGSTGHAGTLQALDFWLTHRGRPRVILLLIGPECGATEDDYRSERANALRLFASIQMRANQGEIWPFIMDGTPKDRSRIIYEAAQFIISLISREATQVTRELVNGFGVGRRVGAHQLPRVWCRLQVFRDSVNAKDLLQQCSQAIVRQTLEREVRTDGA